MSPRAQNLLRSSVNLYILLSGYKRPVGASYLPGFDNLFSNFRRVSSCWSRRSYQECADGNFNDNSSTDDNDDIHSTLNFTSESGDSSLISYDLNANGSGRAARYTIVSSSEASKSDSESNSEDGDKDYDSKPGNLDIKTNHTEKLSDDNVRGIIGFLQHDYEIDSNTGSTSESVSSNDDIAKVLRFVETGEVTLDTESSESSQQTSDPDETLLLDRYLFQNNCNISSTTKYLSALAKDSLISKKSREFINSQDLAMWTQIWQILVSSAKPLPLPTETTPESPSSSLGVKSIKQAIWKTCTDPKADDSLYHDIIRSDSEADSNRSRDDNDSEQYFPESFDKTKKMTLLYRVCNILDSDVIQSKTCHKNYQKHNLFSIEIYDTWFLQQVRKLSTWSPESDAQDNDTELINKAKAITYSYSDNKGVLGLLIKEYIKGDAVASFRYGLTQRWYNQIYMLLTQTVSVLDYVIKSPEFRRSSLLDLESKQKIQYVKNKLMYHIVYDI